MSIGILLGKKLHTVLITLVRRVGVNFYACLSIKTCLISDFSDVFRTGLRFGNLNQYDLVELEREGKRGYLTRALFHWWLCVTLVSRQTFIRE